ncbi:hypothetical protein [Gordonia rhizosphera]|uniref:Uncharacterized protein n=1 Tax=Gordonia rhizosphera NBRC 16068 TaxID=1108045 RepID=K6WIW4_9ACTN|nr:hypothetical protein [Gordonia rhizosphera]GAB93721.1 hypothetical protein GORHZ_242_00050 [Gordonia rhizosphera NBRC 16068]
MADRVRELAERAVAIVYDGAPGEIYGELDALRAAGEHSPLGIIAPNHVTCGCGSCLRSAAQSAPYVCCECGAEAQHEAVDNCATADHHVVVCRYLCMGCAR